MTEAELRERFETWDETYDDDETCDRFNKSDFVSFDNFMLFEAFKAGRADPLSTLEPSLYQNIDKPHLTWSADNFKLLNIDKKEWVPLFRLQEVGE